MTKPDHPAPTVPPPPSGAPRRLLPLAVLAALMALVFAFGWHQHLSFKTIGLNYEALKAFVAGNFPAALAAYMAVYVAVVALSLPGGLAMTTTVASAAFGAASGSTIVNAAVLYCCMGALLSCASPRRA